jgi:hypothetical protein
LKGWVVRMVYELGYNGLSTVINDYGWLMVYDGLLSIMMLYTLHFRLHTPHLSTQFTLHTLHSILHTLHFALYTLHFTLYTFHSTLYILPHLWCFPISAFWNPYHSHACEHSASWAASCFFQRWELWIAAEILASGDPSNHVVSSWAIQNLMECWRMATLSRRAAQHRTY